jgi:multidrug transporter EmrE-like cation transporter
MSVSTIAAIGVFCAMQVIAQLLFKWGSASNGRWLWGFLGGNLFGFSSIWLLMLVYKSMNPNIALAICGGGSFLLAQLALAVIFKSDISLTQWGGVMAIFVGMLLLAAGKPGSM